MNIDLTWPTKETPRPRGQLHAIHRTRPTGPTLISGFMTAEQFIAEPVTRTGSQEAWMLPSETPLISNAFRTFMTEAPKHAQAWSAAVQGLSSASGLDQKTGALAYLAVIAALRLESGVPFHVQVAKKAGATREEVISAVLVGLPAAGNGVTASLPPALKAFDAE